ncbi:hypothetical protein HD554DRAFT_2169798 [Boletus coccyginus]|nr:hypothetical protein HD554DRAFT_2169798 [Boletus coccyginus]
MSRRKRQETMWKGTNRPVVAYGDPSMERSKNGLERSGRNSYTEQLLAARSHLSKWEAHEVAGTYPPWCSAQVPTVKLTKGFEESDEGKTFRSTLASGHSAFQKQALAAHIAAKRKEIAALERSLVAENLLTEVKPVVEAHYKSLSNSLRIPETVEKDGNIQIVRWVKSTLPFDLCRQVLADWVVYIERIRAIVLSAFEAVERKKSTKQRIQESADVEMADRTGPDAPSIQSAVDRAVNAAVRRITSSKDGGKPSSPPHKGQRPKTDRKKAHQTARITTGPGPKKPNAGGGKQSGKGGKPKPPRTKKTDQAQASGSTGKAPGGGKGSGKGKQKA